MPRQQKEAAANWVEVIAGPPEAVAQVMRQAWDTASDPDPAGPAQESLIHRALEQSEEQLAEARSAASEARASLDASSTEANVLHAMLRAAREELEAAHEAAAAAATEVAQERARRQCAEHEAAELAHTLAAVEACRSDEPSQDEGSAAAPEQVDNKSSTSHADATDDETPPEE